MEVAESNKEMLAAWDGEDGAHWAAHAERYESGAAGYRDRLVTAAGVEPGMRVLDFGCGAGRTTLQLAVAAAPGGRALGLDLSRDMLELGRSRAVTEGIDNVEFRQADVQVHDFTQTFDIAVSQFGSMFFGDRVAAFRNIRGALDAEGRLVMLTWQPMARNEWITELRAALSEGGEVPSPPPGVGPYSLSDPDVVRAMLTDAGFRDVEVAGVEGTFRAGADAADALAFVTEVGLVRSVLASFDEAGAQRAREALRRTATEHETADGVCFGSAAWLTTARR